MNDENVIEVSEKRAIVYLPENCVEVEFLCKTYDKGEIVKISKTLNLQEIQKSFADADKNYFEDDDKFDVTDKGLKWLDEHKNSFGFDFE